ncbi:MAG: hypothetical protein EPN72_06315 [Nevskiaceae bacterium]|nr:MAG: hypothetical protein EPN63_10930 [Nevskiaceae bacterium]TBR73456.1 MAG: hypothetical protein EPN72_06315 [Nevskiaceae bacterium]
MAEWTDTFRGVVVASEYDATSYMNSHMYVSRFDQATWMLLKAIGLTPASMRAAGLRFAIMRQNCGFLRELRGGELIRIRSGVLAVGTKYFRLLHQMHDAESDVMLATSDIVAVQASLQTGRSVKLDAALRHRAEALLVTANAPDRALPA